MSVDLLAVIRSVVGLETADLVDCPADVCDSLAVIELCVALDRAGIDISFDELLACPTFLQLTRILHGGPTI